MSPTFHHGRSFLFRSFPRSAHKKPPFFIATRPRRPPDSFVPCSQTIVPPPLHQIFLHCLFGEMHSFHQPPIVLHFLRRRQSCEVGQLAIEHPRPAHSSLVEEDNMIVTWSQFPLAAFIDTGPEEAACVRVIVHHCGPGREALNLRINQGAHREPVVHPLRTW